MAVYLGLKPMSDDIIERSRRLAKKGKDINLVRPLYASEFYRLIAKIAHSFAVAELGYTGFAP
jgi:hypothetical protein